MRCISPIWIRANGGTFVPCGKCNFCLQLKRIDWTFRLTQELKESKSAHFLTLTYDDEHLPMKDGVSQLSKIDINLFMKRLRKRHSMSCRPAIASPAVSVRYYTVGEYGTRTGRAHYHSIMFNLDSDTVGALTSLWGKGHVYVGDVNGASIGYVTKYVINRGQYPDRVPPFANMSKRSGGLGSKYLRTNFWWHKEGQRFHAVLADGVATRLPRFYKDKIFSKGEKEWHRPKAMRLADEAFRDELERLAKFHPDPYMYYFERLHHQHDAISNKVNSNSKF